MNKDVINSRTGVGAGIGGLVGFMFAGPIGAGVGAIVGGSIAHASGDPNRGVMTPKRKVIFERAMESIKDPAELEKLASAFAGEGLPGEATMLRKRAKLRELPKETKDKRRMAFRKAMASDDADLILKLALAFEGEGAIDAAKTLREHADAVRAAHAAGKSTQPMTGGTVAGFADKLAKAIIHFGPASTQAMAAAGNLIRARGKTPSEGLVHEVIRVAADALKVEAPKTNGPPAAPIEVAEVPAEPEVEPEADEPTVESAAEPAAPAAPRANAIEPTIVGPPAGPIEPQVISDGVAVKEGPAAAETLPAPPPDSAEVGQEPAETGAEETTE
jgi:hypothetical protein